MPVNPVGPKPWQPPMPLFIKTEGKSNDPSQKISTDSNGYLRVSGEAANNGIAASQATLSFEGKTVSVPLSAGMTPYQTFQALEKAMPQGYRLNLVHEAGKDVLLEVLSTTRSGPPSRPEPMPPPSRPPDSYQPAPSKPYVPGPGMPPLSPPVDAKVWSGDPAQKIAHDSTGQIRISGLADGGGNDPRVNLYFDGIDVNVQLEAGMTPYQTYEAIAAAMPEGYRANLVFQANHSHSDVLIEVKRSGPAKPKEGDWLR